MVEFYILKAWISSSLWWGPWLYWYKSSH